MAVLRDLLALLRAPNDRHSVASQIGFQALGFAGSLGGRSIALIREHRV